MTGSPNGTVSSITQSEDEAVVHSFKGIRELLIKFAEAHVMYEDTATMFGPNNSGYLKAFSSSTSIYVRRSRSGSKDGKTVPSIRI